MELKLPIGVSDFKEIIENHYTFVDKSLFIKEIIEDGAKVILITRPRRFGKTLNLSMLEYYFSNTTSDQQSLFAGLNIGREIETNKRHMGCYPTIFITFKSAKFEDYATTYLTLCHLLSDCYQAHRYLLDSPQMHSEDITYFKAILEKKGSLIDFHNALKKLTTFLHRHWNQKVVLLIDEYDMPVHASYQNGYYAELLEFMRPLLTTALKDNVDLEKSVLTGILRVAKESIFSGLNNLEVYTLLSREFDQYFGFLQPEVESLIRQSNENQTPTDLQARIAECTQWYNGFQIGRATVYNPWSIIHYVKKDFQLKPYWVNTSDNALVKSLLASATLEVKTDFEQLLQGQTVHQEIDENINFADLANKPLAIWSLLTLSGYLKVVQCELVRGRYLCDLKIPNEEILYLYETSIQNWLGTQGIEDPLVIQYLLQKRIEDFQQYLERFLQESFSFFDVGTRTPENVYHAFVLGLVVCLRDRYQIKSNRESGLGRYDVMLIPHDRTQTGIVLEFKSIDPKSTAAERETAAKQALQQIADRGYVAELEQAGIAQHFSLGIAFAGKTVTIC